MRAVMSAIGSEADFIYLTGKRFGIFDANDVRRLRQLEAENARLKKLFVERDLESEVVKEVGSKNW